MSAPTRSSIQRHPYPVALGALLALGLTACEPPEDAQPCPIAGPEPGTTCLGQIDTSAGETRTYRLHVPAGYEAGSSLPLVLNLPGLGEPSEIQEWGSGMSQFADEQGFIVVYPDSKGMWLTAQLGDSDILFLSELATELTERFAADEKRVYVTGISNGGAMATSLACERADQFAAFAPVAAVVGKQSRLYTCDPTRRPVPMLFLFGAQDLSLPWPGPLDLAADWAERNGADPVAELATGAGADRYLFPHPTNPAGDVTVLLVHQMSHEWPSEGGTGFDGNAEIWDFLKQHTLP